MAYVDGLGRSAPDYQIVLADVRKVLTENVVIDPPVLPKEIAENYGYPVLFATFPESLSNVMGFFDLNADHIVVNASDPANRQTFTIAHELGHARLHRAYLRDHPEQYRVLLRQPMEGQKDPLEQEANAFAANLLVPRAMLERYQKKATIREMATVFIVSEEVIRWRLVNEKLITVSQAG